MGWLISLTQCLGIRSWSVYCSFGIWGLCLCVQICSGCWIHDGNNCKDPGLSSGMWPGQTPGTLFLHLHFLALPNLYYFLCPSAGWRHIQFKWKASLFPLEIAACVAYSSSSLGLHWGMSQSPGLFIFHIMCTLIGALQPRNFLRKHRVGLLTILLQTHFAPFLFPLCHR